MTKPTIAVYVPAALIHDANADSYRLADGFCVSGDMLTLLPHADGTYAAVTQSGNTVAQGELRTRPLAVLGMPDGTRTPLDRVDIDDRLVGLATADPLEPGKTYPALNLLGSGIATTAGGAAGGGAEGGSAQRFSMHPSEHMPCFGPGTVLAGRQGDVPVEWLAPGEEVLTRDHGFANIRWIGRFRLSGGDKARRPGAGVMSIAPNSLGANRPNHLLVLSRAHHILLGGADMELHFATPEALCPAAGLDNGLTIMAEPPAEMILTCILLDRHELVLANGLWVETLFLPNADRFPFAGRPSGIRHSHTSRMCLNLRESQLLTTLKAAEQPALDRSAFVA